MSKVIFRNPRTCGIYKDGGTRFKTDPRTGKRTTEVDNELIEHVSAYLANKSVPSRASISLKDVFGRRVLVPTYYDERHNERFNELLKRNALTSISIGELLDRKTISVRGGHGSPGNDQRSGHIPYVKVSDIRGLRVNINPINLVTERIAEKYWRGSDSGLRAWDVITPNRASSNIGEFAILLPGEERILVTKEVFVFRVIEPNGEIDAFYLLWALSLKAVREQWRRIALMQTNREDCGERYREILLPNPKSKKWAEDASRAFREYFTAIASARQAFIDSAHRSKFEYVANVAATIPLTEEEAEADDGE